MVTSTVTAGLGHIIVFDDCGLRSPVFAETTGASSIIGIEISGLRIIVVITTGGD
jgi:hypothetical protein